jgi:hypothetical protein
MLDQLVQENVVNMTDYAEFIKAYRTVDEVFLIVKVDSSGEEFKKYYSRVLKCWLTHRLFENDLVNPSCYFTTEKDAIAFRNLWLCPIETMNTSIYVRPYKVDLKRAAMLSKLVCA